MRSIYCLFVLMMFGLSSQAQASVKNACEELEATPEILKCLNEYGRELLSEDSEAQRLFDQVLTEDILPRYPYISVEKLGIQSLLEAYTNEYSPYPVQFVQKEREFNRSETLSAQCFNFEKYGKLQRRLAIRGLKSQAREVARFLALFHAKSLGGNSSFVFPLRKVQVCDTEVYGGKERHVMYSQNTMLIGYHYPASSFRAKTEITVPQPNVVTAFEIQREWTSGDMWRRTLQWNLLSQMAVNATSKVTWGLLWDYQEWRDAWFVGWHKDAVAPILDRIADYWPLLDPVSEARILLLRKIANLMPQIESRSADKYGSMLRVATSEGFPVAERDFLLSLGSNDSELQSIYDLWKVKMFSPKTVVRAIESSMGSGSSGAQLEMIAREVKDSTVNVRNAKSFDISTFFNLGGVDIQEFKYGEPHSEASIESEYIHEDYDGKGNVISRKSLSTTQKGQSDIYVNLDKSDDVFVNIDLIDKFDIETSFIPSFSGQQLKAYALYLAINEHLERN